MIEKTFNILPPLGNIESYIDYVKNIPLLSVQEERALFTNFINYNDLVSAQKLVFSHLRFVLHIVRNYKGYGLLQSDLIQEGNIGLMKAIKHFDPSQNVRLASFAVYWIKSEIHEYIIKNWKIVKIATTKAQRKLFFNLRKTNNKLGWLKSNEIENIAKNLNVTCTDVKEMEGRLSNNDISLIIDEEEGNEYLIKNIESPETLIENWEYNNNRSIALKCALDKLDERSKYIIEQRLLVENKSTLQELANKFNVSVERIRQIENSSISKLKQLIKSK